MSLRWPVNSVIVYALLCYALVATGCRTRDADPIEQLDGHEGDVDFYYDRAFQRQNEGEFEKAIADFSEVIKLNPKSAVTYCSRGCVWHEMGEYNKAILDFDEAIRLEPADPDNYVHRALSWDDLGEYDRSISSYNKAIELSPSNAIYYYFRGLTWENKFEYEKATSDYDTSIELDPNSREVLHLVAWFFATCPDVKFRNGTKAVQYARKSCELSEWKNSDALASLAAAYAETGDFDEALNRQQQAIDIAPKEKVGDYMSKLKLYKVHKPYRQNAKKYF